MLPPPQPAPAAKNTRTISPRPAIRRRRRDGTPSRKIPANKTLLPVAHQPKPCGLSEADVPGRTCGATVEIVIIAVAPDALAVTEVGLMEQVICALAEDGWQVRPTVPLKPAIDVTVICDVACWPGAEAAADKPSRPDQGMPS